MPDQVNYLLGRGERLTSQVKRIPRGDEKKPAYSFKDAVGRVAPALQETVADFDALPAIACPYDEAVAALTLHPRFISKSDHPVKVLESVGLHPIGSKASRISPDEWGIERHPEVAPTTVLFVAGPRESFRAWSEQILSWEPTATHAQIARFERLEPVTAADRVRAIPDVDEVKLELVLHSDAGGKVLSAFADYAESQGVRLDLQRGRQIGGLCFLRAFAKREQIDELADFTYLRVVRGMPSLRPLTVPIIKMAKGAPEVTLPSGSIIDSNTRVAVFDGGLPDGVSLPWVQEFNTPGVGAKDSDCTEHGLMVTSALSFGHLTPGVVPEPAFSGIDHYRVLGDDPGSRELDAYDVLDRIVSVMKAPENDYRFVNISLGPRMALDDNDVGRWTAELDALFHQTKVLATVAAGNDGDLDDTFGDNRVQPPSDGVNVLAVGSCGSSGDNWSVADYSCVGPGRCPGIVKPDVVGFGGSISEPFLAMEAPSNLTATWGTSFSAPAVLRLGIGMHAVLGSDLSPLAIRALLIHRADIGKETTPKAGWGRVPDRLSDLLTSDDNTVHVVYQGTLPFGSQIRAEIPTPEGGFKGALEITATLCISSDVDPEHASTYTRSGLEVTFRPHDGVFKMKDGIPSAYPKSDSFFSRGSMYPGEYVLRSDGHKWEPVIKARKVKHAASLSRPVFDIYRHEREAGSAPGEVEDLPYALVVTVRGKSMPDLYNAVLRAYQNVLVPLQPRVAVPIRV